MPDAHKNLAYSTVLIPPSPALSGTTLTVALATGSLFPTPPFNATVWPFIGPPLASDAEIVRVTAIVGDVLTILRAQEGTSARTIIGGDQIANTLTAKCLTDIELSLPTENAGDPNGVVDGNKARQVYDSVNERYWRKTTDSGTLTGWV